MGKQKIYLSLDDLHKLYGISPEVIKQIKKKRRKRRLKKQLKDNFGSAKQDSSHMKGYSLSRTNALEEGKIEARIKMISDNNEKLQNETKQQSPEEQAAQRILQDVKSGTLKMKQSKTGISITNPSLRKKRLTKNPNIMEIFEEFDRTQNTSGLSGAQSHTMMRENPDEINVLSYGDDTYDAPTTFGSDYFTNQAIDEMQETQQPALSSLQVETEPPLAAKYNPKLIGEFKLNELKKIAKDNNINIDKMTKPLIYNVLYENFLL